MGLAGAMMFLVMEMVRIGGASPPYVCCLRSVTWVGEEI